MIQGYKLFRKRKDGTYGPLFLNASLRMVPGVVYHAENHTKAGYMVRPWFHACAKPYAPHLSMRGRVWCLVNLEVAGLLPKPAHQGGTWYLANSLTIVQELNWCATSQRRFIGCLRVDCITTLKHAVRSATLPTSTTIPTLLKMPRIPCF